MKRIEVVWNNQRMYLPTYGLGIQERGAERPSALFWIGTEWSIDIRESYDSLKLRIDALDGPSDPEAKLKELVDAVMRYADPKSSVYGEPEAYHKMMSLARAALEAK